MLLEKPSNDSFEQLMLCALYKGPDVARGWDLSKMKRIQGRGLWSTVSSGDKSGRRELCGGPVLDLNVTSAGKL